jgi:addiction module HigA family antidote
MPMKNPVHPGNVFRHGYLEYLNLSVTEAAKILGVSRQALNNVVNEKAAVSADMAIRISKAFGNTPDLWVRMQAAYDLAQARKNEASIQVKRYRPSKAA